MLESVKNSKSKRELYDIQQYIQFLFITHVKQDEEEYIVKNGKNRKFFELINRCQIPKFTRTFCLSPVSFIKNFSSNNKLYRPQEPLEKPTTFSYSLCNEIYLDQEVKVLNVSVIYAGYVLAHFPFIKSYFRKIFLKNATISTFPTEIGKNVLDVYHKSFRVKRIKEKPLEKLDPKDCLILDILNNTQMNLIHYKVNFDETILKDQYLTRFSYLYCGDVMNETHNYTKEWNLLRELAILEFFPKIISELKKDVIDDLKEKEGKFVMKECCKSLSKHISEGVSVNNCIISYYYDPESKEDVRILFIIRRFTQLFLILTVTFWKPKSLISYVKR